MTSKTTPAKAAVGFVGIGMMGWPMARCLLRAGFDIVVYDADAERASRFAETVGGTAAASLGDLGRRVGLVITMLPNSQIVSDVLFGEDDPLALSLASGATVVDMTSGVPDTTIALAERLKAGGVRMIDAPVSGGLPRAESGDLAIMAGGDEAILEDCRATLESMGSVTHVGVLGAGQAMKALNNLVSAGGFLVGIEALLIGKKFGLDPETMVDILNASSGMNNSTQRKFKQYVLSRSFASGFTIDLMVKDLTIALDMARTSGAAVPFSVLCRELWATGGKMIGGKHDHTEIAAMSEVFAQARLTDDTAPEGETPKAGA